MSHTAKATTAFEERERNLPLWVQEKLDAGRKAWEWAGLYEGELREAKEQIAELRQQLAEGISKPDSNTWITQDGDVEDEGADIGLGESPVVYFGRDTVDPDFEVRLVDGDLLVRSAGHTAIAQSPVSWDLKIFRL